MLNVVLIILHLVAINIWVGGMFFIIVVLAKVVGTLEVPEQHIVWNAVLRRFFFWVWLAVMSLLGSGVGMILYRFGGLTAAPAYVVVMTGFGVLMALVFFLIYFVYYQKFQQQLLAGNIAATRDQLRIIRLLGIVNMVLGLCVVIVIGAGPHFSW